MADTKIETYREAWKSYKSVAEEGHRLNAQRASELVRQLAFAGIAVVWVLRETTISGKITLASELRGSAAFFILTLVFDLMHYLIGASQFASRLDAVEHEVNEANRKGKDWPEHPTTPPPPLPEKIVKTFFYAKASSVIIGSALLLFYLAYRV